MAVRTMSKLKRKRLDRKMTRVQVAEYLGLQGVSSIANWETGRCYPPVRHLVKLAKLYDCFMEELLEDSVLTEWKGG